MDSFKDRCVIVQGFAGLGNRLRTVAAAIEYAGNTGRSLCVNWSDGMFAEEGENAFDRFFEIYDFNTIKVTDIITDSYYPIGFDSSMLLCSITKYYEKKESRKFIVRKCINLLCHLMKLFKFDELCYRLALKNKYYNPLDERLGKMVFGGELKDLKKEAVLFVDNVPKYKKNILENHVGLKKDINDEINSFVMENGLDKDSLGIHIRATDKRYKGSLARLYKQIDSFVKRKGINSIFLCTDNKQVEEDMKDYFAKSHPDNDIRIVTIPKFLPDNLNTKMGIHHWAMIGDNYKYKDQMYYEAVQDMFILSKTEYMLYHWGSTFSEISKVYHSNKKKCMSWRKFEVLGRI